MLIFVFVWCGSFHTALFTSEPEIVKKTTRVHSLVNLFNPTRVGLEADGDLLFSWVWVRLFGPVFAVSKISTSRGETNLSSI